MIGMFYNQFLPGGTGGDIIKSYLLLKETPGKATGALLAVVFDRLVGLVALITITGTLICLRDQWLTQLPETRHLVWLFLAVLGSAVLMLLTSFVVSGLNLAHKLPQRFPGAKSSSNSPPLIIFTRIIGAPPSSPSASRSSRISRLSPPSSVSPTPSAPRSP